MNKPKNLHQYRMGEYLRNNISGHFFKIIGVQKGFIKIQSMHSHYKFTLSIDEAATRFTLVTFAYIGELSRKLIDEINKTIQHSDDVLLGTAKGILEHKWAKQI